MNGALIFALDALRRRNSEDHRRSISVPATRDA
jgi:hypothetical protein